jgi:hypothetical protein
VGDKWRRGRKRRRKGGVKWRDGSKRQVQQEYRRMAVRRREGSQITEGRRVLNSERKRKVQANK